MKSQRQRALAVQWFAAVFSILGLLLAVTGAWWQAKLRAIAAPSIQREEIDAVKGQVLDLHKQVDSLTSRLDAIYDQLLTNPDAQALDKRDNEPGKFSSELTNVKGSVEDLTSRFTKIEGLIVQDPSKALEIPLMRKDMEALKEANQVSNAALRQDLERAYNLLVGTVVALAIAVIAPLVSNIFSRRRGIEKKT